MPKDNGDNLTNVVKVDFKSRTLALDNMSLSHETKEQNEKKWILFDKWLCEGTVSVLFDARLKGVKVPGEFKNRGDLRLNFSHDFMVPDFNANEFGVWATLSFESGEFFCMVPWTSVYGLQSLKVNQGAVWFESFPSDLDQMMVLGFSEEMCQTLTNDEELAFPSARDNVVLLDFSSAKDKGL